MKSHKQTGSAHVVIIIVLVVVVLGLVGYVFWNNFINKKPATTKPTVTSKSVPSASLKTYTESSYGISFKYPSDWTVKVLSDAPLKNNDGLASLEVDVSDSDGVAVASLSTDFEGGSVCDNTITEQLQTSDLTPLSLEGSTGSPVYVAVISSAVNNGTNLAYGITDASNAPSSDGVSSATCDDPSTYFAVRSPSTGLAIDAPYGSVAFYKSTEYNSVQDAQIFLQSSEYKQIAQMIQSLTTTAITQ
jgi:cytoskeletal protein RodZ